MAESALLTAPSNLSRDRLVESGLTRVVGGGGLDSFLLGVAGPLVRGGLLTGIPNLAGSVRGVAGKLAAAVEDSDTVLFLTGVA